MKSKLITITVFLFLAVPSFCSAEIVRIDIQAVVDSVTDSGNYLEGKIHKDSIIMGYYKFDSTVPDSAPSDPVQGNYWNNEFPNGVLLYLEGFTFQTNPNNLAFLIAIRNNIIPTGEDIYSFGSSNNQSLTNGTLVESITWQLLDRTGKALNSDLLQLTPPVLSDYQSNHLIIHGERGGYIIDSHVISATPEPATMFLLFTGSLMLLRKKK